MHPPHAVEVFPFAAMLLAIALLPVVAPRLWHSNKNKLLLSLLLGLPAAAATLAQGAGAELLHAARDYVDFVLLLAALYAISGGILVEGRLEGRPIVNTALLLLGSVSASFLGTTGASMLFLRPLLHANRRREHVSHTVVFFIFLVANIGGSLLPTGDAPLYLGYLNRVPFFWTLRLWPEWLFCCTVLLALHHLWDRILFAREMPRAGPEDAHSLETLRLRGLVNLPLLGLALSSAALLRDPWRGLGLITAMLLSLGLTPRGVRQAHHFTWAPMAEVAALFLGIFATIPPALALVEAKAPALRLSTPSHFFWATGLFSAVLDNAPTYLTALAAVRGLGQPAEVAGVAAGHLRAISLGAVFFGALTYIGNGPNFLVRAIAEQRRVRMPGFFGYAARAAVCLLPLFALLDVLFL